MGLWDGWERDKYWSAGDRRWQDLHQIDEFGPGTLDGNPAHGASHDACACAAIEQAAAALEGRDPNYINVGKIRADMTAGGHFNAGATLADIQWEIPRRKYEVAYFHDWQETTLPGSVIGHACSFRAPVIVELHNAAALLHNEPGVVNHFVTIAAWSTGSDPSEPHLYVLNSDQARAFRPVNGGPEVGEWVTLSDFLRADPRGYAVMRQPVAPPPPPPPPGPDVRGAVVDLNQIKAMVDQLVADALAKLKAS